MPWELRAGRDDQWCVHKEGEDEAVPGGCHPTRDEALRHQRALYAAERERGMTAAVSPEPAAAGVALVATDTGRVLMIQRAMIGGEPACGKWEFPGGRLDEGEAPLDGALREFAEETGHPVPEGSVEAATWLSADGVYRGYVFLAASEGDFPLGATDPGNREVEDPDNEGGSNYTEALAWFDPWDVDRGPKILREECKSTPWKIIKDAGPGRGGGAMAASADVQVTIDEEALARAIRAAIHVGPPREDAPNRDIESLVAAVEAPANAFLPAEDLPAPTPFTVADDGTHDGHLALWASCHIGYPGCVTPPREDSFDFYNLGDVVTADGRHVPVGKVTVGCGHAGGDLSWRTASAHYDNSGTAVGAAHAVADRWGIRLPGALVADVSGRQVDELRRSPLSGDWRRVHGPRSPLRLIAALGVNVPGYPVPRALVAAGEVQSMFVGFNPEDAAALQVEADELADELGIGPVSRAEALRAAVLR